MFFERFDGSAVGIVFALLTTRLRLPQLTSELRRGQCYDPTPSHDDRGVETVDGSALYASRPAFAKTVRRDRPTLRDQFVHVADEHEYRIRDLEMRLPR